MWTSGVRLALSISDSVEVRRCCTPIRVVMRRVAALSPMEHLTRAAWFSSTPSANFKILTEKKPTKELLVRGKLAKTLS